MKYLEEDLEAIVKGQKTIDEVANQYGVSHDTLKRNLNRRGYHVRKTKVKVFTPYYTRVYGSIQECADTLKLSRLTIVRALKGERVKVLEELEIKLEVAK